MSEMIERIARKLEPQAWAALGIGDRLAYSFRRTSSLRKARAAIEAMREPTAAMIEAEPPDDGEFNKENSAAHAKAFWQAMIDAAL